MILYFVHTIYNTKHAGAAFIKKKKESSFDLSIHVVTKRIFLTHVTKSTTIYCHFNKSCKM